MDMSREEAFEKEITELEEGESKIKEGGNFFLILTNSLHACDILAKNSSIRCVKYLGVATVPEGDVRGVGSLEEMTRKFHNFRMS
jgi:hypothetical protein